MRIGTALCFALASIIAVQPANACRDPADNTVTLLERLPVTAGSEPIVARVQVIELVEPRFNNPDWKYTSLAKVRVVEAIKGVQEGQTLLVHTRGSSCDQYFRKGELEARAPDWKPYIAGQINVEDAENVFSGRWSEDRSGNLTRSRR